METKKFIIISACFIVAGFIISSIKSSRPRDVAKVKNSIYGYFPNSKVYRLSNTSSGTLWYVVDTNGEFYEVHTSNIDDSKVTAIKKGIPQ